MRIRIHSPDILYRQSWIWILAVLWIRILKFTQNSLICIHMRAALKRLLPKFWEKTLLKKEFKKSFSLNKIFN